MKKVGIITFHRALNYGAVLQTYALQQFLLQNGIENEVLDYKCKAIEDFYKPFHVIRGKYINALIRGICFYFTIKRKHKNFNTFVNNKIILSKRYETSEEIKNDAENYEKFITGSDQVWNYNLTGSDKAYFLDFAQNHQKISYAASIGIKSLSAELFQFYKTQVESFYSISVREESAKELLEDAYAGEICTNIDPTLLLNGTQWKKITKTPKETRYVLIFNVEKPKDDIKLAKNIARKKNLRVIYINDRSLIKDPDIKYISAPDIESFLGYFANADIVVTNSFHGTVFGIIFQRELYVETKNRLNHNIRSEALLRLLKIDRRIVECSNMDEIDILPIDWNEVEEIIEKKREDSLEYIKKALNLD